MSVDGDFFRYQDGQLLPVGETLSEHLSVADSFLVSNGMTRRLDLHFERFQHSVLKLRPGQSDFDDFFSLVVELLPRVGDWFPRLEFRDDCEVGCFFLRVRPAPKLVETLTLWTNPEPDPRQDPSIKGPDLSLCQQLRRAANLHGADEAVLLDSSGFIADGALSAIVWWDGDVLCAPDETTRWLPSITRKIVLEMAEQAGYKTVELAARPVDLAGKEVWSLSALQGIRGVTQWGELDVAAPKRLSAFRKRLSLLATPIQS